MQNKESNFYLADRAIEVINERLEEYSKRLKELQPKKSGSVQLELHNCSGCKGCPHVRWKVWGWKKRGKDKPVWVAMDIKNPAKRLKKSGEFSEVYEESKQVINEAMYLIKARKDLLEYHRRLGAVMRRFK